MKNINIIYWIFTILLALLMLSSAIPSLINTPESHDFMVNKLHYPDYFGYFLGIAKIFGVIAILVPGFPRIKEWAYAGFTFDLIAATYSLAAIHTPLSNLAPFILFFILVAGSYSYYHKRLQVKASSPLG